MSRRIIEHKIISSYDADDVSRDLNRLLDGEGLWEPLGVLDVKFIALTRQARSNVVALNLYTQVMVIYEEVEEAS